METFKSKIYNRIENWDSKYVFTANDFLDIADYETVRKRLNRMVLSGDVRRIIKGFYYKPKYISLIDEYEAPVAHEVAKAIARKYNWTIAPSGNTALNILGLSTQVPAKWTYVSDGRYADFSYGKVTIRFKHRNNGEISNISFLSSMVIQALKALGKDSVTEKHIRHLSKILSADNKIKLLEEGKSTSAWVYRVIKKICEG